jgi:hypothetical protein
MVLASALGAAHGLLNMAHDRAAMCICSNLAGDAIPLDVVKPRERNRT